MEAHQEFSYANINCERQNGTPSAQKHGSRKTGIRISLIVWLICVLLYPPALGGGGVVSV